MDSAIKLIATLALALGLAACGEPGGDDHAGHEHDADGNHIEQPAVVETPDTAADEYPQATIDGTMTMFVEALSRGEFLLASDVCDPTSIEVQEKFTERAKASTFPFEGNPNVTEDVIAFVREQLSKPYRGAQWTIVDEGDDQATVSLTLVDGRSSELTLVNEDDAWYVFPYDGFLDWGEKSISGNMQRNQGGGDEDGGN